MERIKELGLIIDLDAFREISCGYMISPTAGMVVEVEHRNRMEIRHDCFIPDNKPCFVIVIFCFYMTAVGFLLAHLLRRTYSDEYHN
jgi:hypothetical protein